MTREQLEYATALANDLERGKYPYSAMTVRRLIEDRTRLSEALESVLTWMTNVNTFEPHEISAKVIKALKATGYDPELLDSAAIALVSGAAAFL